LNSNSVNVPHLETVQKNSLRNTTFCCRRTSLGQFTGFTEACREGASSTTCSDCPHPSVSKNDISCERCELGKYAAIGSGGYAQCTADYYGALFECFAYLTFPECDGLDAQFAGIGSCQVKLVYGNDAGEIARCELCPSDTFQNTPGSTTSSSSIFITRSPQRHGQR